MEKKNEFLFMLSAATLLIIIFSTMFLSFKVRSGVQAKSSSAALLQGK